jgi:hypothetical protein
MFPFDWHQVIARFCDTIRFESSTSILFPITTKGKFSGSLGDAYVCRRRRRDKYWVSKESQISGKALLEWGIHPSNCREFRKISKNWRRKPKRKRPLPCRTLHRVIGNVLDQPCPTIASSPVYHRPWLLLWGNLHRSSLCIDSRSVCWRIGS